MNKKTVVHFFTSFLYMLVISNGCQCLTTIDTATGEHIVCENWSKPQQKCFRTGLAVQCFRGIDDLMTLHPGKLKQIEELIICDWPNPSTFDLNVLKPFASIKKFIVEHSNFTHFRHDFPELEHLESVNISWTNLEVVRTSLFRRLPFLKYVDLRWNRLAHMDQPHLNDDFSEMYLKDNPWNCTKNLKWLNIYPIEHHRVVDKADLKCVDTKYNGRPVSVVMQYKLQLKGECMQNAELRNCSCHVNYIRPSDDGLAYTPMYAINCSALNFYRLPNQLPANTSILYAANNYITNLQPLRSNPYYKEVYDIYLDHNGIERLDELEHSEWIENFRILSLRGNNLSKIHVYAIVAALEKNQHVGKFSLGNNPWKCECNFTPKFQDMLRKFQNIISDYKNVTCRQVEGDKNSGSQILWLRRSDVCQLPSDYLVEPLDILNGVLLSLILMILSKLAYDYYYYKYYGRVPWIVTKMP